MSAGGRPGASEMPACMAEPEPVRKAHRFAVGQYVLVSDVAGKGRQHTRMYEADLTVST